ncbi:response regulator [Rhizobium sp.]|uniref:response regulator n=1 Tax=Rhizobium sp. TaxID=391 RepID=UPI0034C6C267
MNQVPFLLVDDLEENLLALEVLLRRDDVLLLKARSGDQALELLLKHDVALALVDVHMPGLSGFELAELLRGNERTRHIPIIFVTAGSGDARPRFRGYEAGAVDFIQKPIEPDVLRSKAAVFHELYRQRQQLAVQRDALAAQAEALKSAARDKDLLLREINHRIKNLFSLAAGLISLSAKSATSAAELANELRSRLQALARAHELTLPDLSANGELRAAATTVKTLLRAILAPYEHEQGAKIIIQGSDHPLEGNALTSFALLMHELVTNSAKYGALSTPTGALTVDLSVSDSLLRLLWGETVSSGRPNRSAREGFGTTLEKAALTALNGSMMKDWHDDGLRFSVEVPIAGLSM